MMQKNPIPALFLIFIVLIFSCKNYKRAKKYNGDFVLVDSIQVRINNNISPHTTINKYILIDSTEYLLWYNQFDNSIVLLNLTNPDIERTIHFENEGPLKVPQILGASIFSFDSIYLQSTYPGKLYRVDTTGRPLDYVTFADTSTNGGMSSFTQINSKYFNDLFKVDKNQFLVHIRNPTTRTLNEEAIFEFPLFLLIDINDNTARSLPCRLPGYLMENGDRLPSYRSSCYDGRKLVYSFAGDHNLHVVPDLNKKDQLLEMRSKYVDKIQPLNKTNNPFEYNATSYQYTSILYDSYRDIYYRIVKHPAEEISDLDLREEYNYPSNFSIMILNSNLELMDEILFSDTYYNMYSIFPGKRGLYISKSNPKNPHWKEDYLEFDIYRNGETSEDFRDY